MDRQDEQNGKMEEIHQRLLTAYCQFGTTFQQASEAMQEKNSDNDEASGPKDLEDITPGLIH